MVIISIEQLPIAILESPVVADVPHSAFSPIAMLLSVCSTVIPPIAPLPIATFLIPTVIAPSAPPPIPIFC